MTVRSHTRYSAPSTLLVHPTVAQAHAWNRASPYFHDNSLTEEGMEPKQRQHRQRRRLREGEFSRTCLTCELDIFVTWQVGIEFNVGFTNRVCIWPHYIDCIYIYFRKHTHPLFLGLSAVWWCGGGEDWFFDSPPPKPAIFRTFHSCQTREREGYEKKHLQTFSFSQRTARTIERRRPGGKRHHNSGGKAGSWFEALRCC